MQVFYYNTLFKNIEILLNKFHCVFDVKKQSEYLISYIEKTLQDNKLKYNDIDFFSTISGPGNFTSIKTNLAVAKAIRVASNKNIICSNLFDIIGFNKKYDYIVVEANPCKYYVKSKNGEYFITKNIDELSGEILSKFDNKDWIKLTEHKIKNNILNEFDAFYMENASIGSGAK
ncbi:MAG: hypothetical protein LBC92_05010 [Rickettsiales bacterium]|jgi:tRNA A37 threonylcarbamoyladenosine modification protein TsaB|nr:hypothetical protein [Rickettsiales bacterium]